MYDAAYVALAERLSAVLVTADARLARAPGVQCPVEAWRSGDQSVHAYRHGIGAEETTTARVRRPDSERLHSLAKSRQTTVVEVVHSAIEALERQEFLGGLDEDYRRLREDPERWEAYQAERQEWDPLG